MMARGGYIGTLRKTIDAALCLQNFPCQIVERQNKPEIEFQSSPELILKPIVICKNESERCAIETSVNSVRISFKFKTRDKTEELLKTMFIKMLLQRAENFHIMRRVPLEGYDISFLITNFHLEKYQKSKLLDFICTFVEDFSSEISELRLLTNQRGRAVGAEVAKAFAEGIML